MNIRIEQGDITSYRIDAVVNAANSGLLGGGGVDGAIHRAGGPKILQECQQIRLAHGGCKTGDAVVTTAGNLKAKVVIHTVGPVWSRGNEAEKQLLLDCYRNSMSLAMQLKCRSIAFPNISTGVYKFPKDLAAGLVLKLFTDPKFQEDFKEIHDVVFVNFDDENYEIYQQKMKEILEGQ